VKTKSVEAARLSSSLESETVRLLGDKHLHLVDLTWIEQAEVLLRPLECPVLRRSAWFRVAGKFRFFCARRNDWLWHKSEVRDVRYLVAMRGKADVADIAFCRYGGHTRRTSARGGGAWQRSMASPGSALLREKHFAPAEIQKRRYCVRNLYAAIRATMLAKISSARRNFRIIGRVEWRAADRLG
jgi:hypothetical protein